MSCPYFRAEYVGICGASESPYVPSIEEMENHCFRETYHLCEVFGGHLSRDEIGRLRHNSVWLRHHAGAKVNQGVRAERVGK